MFYDLNLTAQSIIKESEKAVCFLDGTREIWIPRKLLSWKDRGQCYCESAQVPLWFAKDRGLISTGRNPGF